MTTSDGERKSVSHTVRAEAVLLGGMKKRARARDFTIMCDEGPPLGENTAPAPMTYFAVSILF